MPLPVAIKEVLPLIPLERFNVPLPAVVKEVPSLIVAAIVEVPVALVIVGVVPLRVRPVACVEEIVQPEVLKVMALTPILAEIVIA